MKLNEFNNAFQNEQQCLAYIANLKENKCIRCFSFNLNTSDLKRMRCLKCNQTFSILTGTIFSRSQTSLTSWLVCSPTGLYILVSNSLPPQELPLLVSIFY
ncbi:hypothetical protein [Spiroplasma endosymbiont of Apeira syringaria]|uniref:hypothetical protein n=1 Tax=Spiroplasma endosymbiont of Apeira syringaria TaxID=3066307 RepID=UPI0030CF4959